MFTSESRSLQSRGTEQVEKTSVLPQNMVVKRSVVITEEIRVATEKAVRKKAEKKAGSSMYVWSLALSYYITDGAQSFEDVAVIARITYKLATEKPFPDINNYTSEVINYSLAELIYGDRSSGRRPVTTSQMLDNKSEELDFKEKMKLTKLAKKMMKGEQNDVDKELEVMANERRRLAKERVAKIDENSTNEEIAIAIDEVSKAVLLSDSSEDEILMGEIAQKQRKKLKESERRYKSRPESPLQQKLLLDDIINQQKLTGHDETNSAFGNQILGKHPIDRDMARRLVYKLAEEKIPTGAKILSVDVNFSYVINAGWLLDISIQYESIGHRGIPEIDSNSYLMFLKDLVPSNKAKRPVVPIR